jgi:tetratricopeptide (TPR) repeat protein
VSMTKDATKQSVTLSEGRVPKNQAWILGPIADSLLFLFTPILIVPIILGSLQVWKDQVISLVVLSFFTIGHFLPGFLRAYGNKSLRSRFWKRLFFVPPLIFLVAWVFADKDLHGLRVVILLWATWHGLMQTYGFMRIYDLKAKIESTQTQRANFWVCISLFASGIVFSEGRMFGLVSAVADCGLSIPSVSQVQTLRIVVLIASIASLIWFMKCFITDYKQTGRLGWQKIVFLVTTFIAWWACGVFIHSILIGVVVFEIFHAIQYYGIVWAFHQKSLTKYAESIKRLPVKLTKLLMIIGVAVLILAIGGLRYRQEGLHADLAIKNLIIAFLATCTLMHYYFDGFIWKVHEKENQSAIDTKVKVGKEAVVPFIKHAAKWSLFVLPLLFLGAAEVNSNQRSDALRQERKLAAAVTLAEIAPHISHAHLMVADLYLQENKLDEAKAALENALKSDQDLPQARFNLAQVSLELGDLEVAESEFKKLISIENESFMSREGFSSFKIMRGRTLFAEKKYVEAMIHFQEAIEYAPESFDAHGWYLTSFLRDRFQQESSFAQAIKDADVIVLETALEEIEHWLPKERTDREYLLAHVFFEYGYTGLAKTYSEKAIQASDENGKAHLLLGRILYHRGTEQIQIGLTLLDDPLAEARTHFQRAEALGISIPKEYQQTEHEETP